MRWCNANGNVIKTGDELAVEKNLEIFQKDAQIKQALLLAIEMGLKLKFGNENVAILSDISTINDVKLLEAIVSQIPNFASTDELQKLYSE